MSVDTLPLEVVRLIDRVCDEFEDGLDKNEEPRLEQFLTQVPQEARPKLLRELLVLDQAARRKAGKPAATEEYLRQLAPLGAWAEKVVIDLFRFQVRLVVTDGPNSGAVYDFAEHDTFLVGRSSEAHFRLADDPYFSRMHFLIEVNPPLCRLLDLRSTNGTKVNGASVASADLADGDRIVGGQTAIRVAIWRAVSPEDTDATRSLPARDATPLDKQWSTLSTVRQKSDKPVARDEPAVPQIPGFRCERKLGEGGMGVVWLAHREADGQAVALKTIRPAVAGDEAAVQRFLREAGLLQKLRHPNLVGGFSQGRADDLLYCEMEYVPGIDAGKLLRQCGPLPVGRAVRLVCDLLEGLAYAHALGLVHRDVKPSNLLVMDENGQEKAKLADFGLGRAYQESHLSGLTLTNSTGGTPDYMPPEQITNFRHVQPAADQFSAAASLYTLLTGRTVHGKTATVQEMLERILTREPEAIEHLRPGLPAPLCAALRRALTRQPANRFPDVSSLKKALVPFISAS